MQAEAFPLSNIFLQVAQSPVQFLEELAADPTELQSVHAREEQVSPGLGIQSLAFGCNRCYGKVALFLFLYRYYCLFYLVQWAIYS